ncbi:MAG TPA: hypothetical protein ENJ82_01805 [Bacteroidetes bacterium]|nr:hypothetical protein [Bacteroidota bacterium]
MQIQFRPFWALIFGLALVLTLLIFPACKGGKAPLAGSVPPKIYISAAEHNYEKAIIAFEKMEQDSPSTKGGIVFTGSSSIRKWETLVEDMAPLPVINRGFGGSIIRQVSFYANRFLIPLAPQLIVFYCGENDICNDLSSHTDPLRNFKDFTAIIRYYLPQTHILYLSMKPSPLRWQYWEKFSKGNELIRAYTETDEKLRYLDVGEIMIGEDGRPKTHIWVSDSLHMNEAGYADWTNIVRPVVRSMWENVRQQPVNKEKRMQGKRRNIAE